MNSWSRVVGAGVLFVVIASGCSSAGLIEATTRDDVVVDPTQLPTTPPVATAADPSPTPLTIEATPTPTAPTPTAPTLPPEPSPLAQPTSPAVAGSPTAAPVIGSQATLIANGGEVYTLNCARCHAEDGTGSDRYRGLIGVGSNYSAQGMIQELTTGHPVTFGFADRLSTDEIASVVAYVKATFP